MAEIVRLGIQVAEGLEAAHRSGLVHRDLKPGNIFLDEAGNACIGDFGLALHESDQASRRGEISGTPAYMAPEQIQGLSHHLDGRADIWSLGVILYELLTGARPFHGQTTNELFEEIAQREPKPLRLKNPEIPPAIEDIVNKCLRKSVADRYATAADVANDLRRWQERQAEEAVGGSTSTLRNRGALIVISLLLLTVGGLATFAWINGGLSQPKDIGSPSVAGANPTTPAALTADVTIRVWGRGKSGLSIEDPNALPLRNGDQVRFDVQLSRPAHVYLLWVDSSGAGRGGLSARPRSRIPGRSAA